ncbi:Rho- GTP-binding protein RhoN [Linnemannia gamsii]|uniref:Rho- GTP-binding protein RhoN n=1 Tax=Linnemannia gamsii TaxID=64522 RepID=A0ABQ7KCX4_9FUNG|nr:Rho- GTP-binding protein RhoN [Linnemannia gamsii]
MLRIRLAKHPMASPWSSRTLTTTRSTTRSHLSTPQRPIPHVRSCQVQARFPNPLKLTRTYSTHPNPTGGSQYSLADGSTSLSTSPRYILFRVPTPFQAIVKPILFTAATSFGVFATAAYVWERQQVSLIKRIQAWRSSSRSERPSAREFVQAQSEILQEQWGDISERYRWIQQIRIPVELQKMLFMMRSRWMELTPGERTIWSLIAINSVVFGAWQVPRWSPFMQKWFMHDPSSSRSVTLLTSMFSHQHFWHFGLNMFALHSFAVPLHDQMGREQFLAFYLTTGVTASLASHLFTVARVPWAKMIPSLGASGALFGCISSTAYMYPDASVYIIFLPFLPIKIPVALGAMMGLDLVGILKNWKMFDHYAHLAGSTFGLAYMYAGKDLVWTPLQQEAIELNKDAKLFGKGAPTETKTPVRPRGSSVIEVTSDNTTDKEERSAKDIVQAKFDRVKGWWNSKGN